MKFKPGILGGSFSGSLGNVVASHNRYGAYLRDRAMPVNPSSSLQQAIRSKFASLAYDWANTLTLAQRTAWNLYASSVTKKDKSGDDIHVTGYNMYLRSNLVVLAGGYTQVDDGPTIFTLAASDAQMAPTISEATQLISVAFDVNLAWLDEDDAGMQISMSKPVSAGRSFIPANIRVAGFIDGDSGTPPTSPQTLACPYVVTEDQLVIVEGRIVRADGRLSEPFRGTTTIAS